MLCCQVFDIVLDIFCRFFLLPVWRDAKLEAEACDGVAEIRIEKEDEKEDEEVFIMKALVLDSADKKNVSASVKDISDQDLPEGEVLLEVAASGFNYKDGMAIRGLGNLVREYPHVPGIDTAGTVLESSSDAFKAGDQVIATGFRLGEWHWGGFAERVRLPDASFAVSLPSGFTANAAMACGTAAFTAMLAMARLQEVGITKEKGKILVTGASGGVGSFAVMFFSREGYEVVASTGGDHEAYLKKLGASEVISRDEFKEPLDPRKPLEKTRWAGVVDSVGGAPLSRVLAQTQAHGGVASIGLTAGFNLSGTVLPFLLRGISLLGVDSAMYPAKHRAGLWERIAKLFREEDFAEVAHVHGLAELPQLADDILAGKIRGRAVIDPKR